MLERIYHPTIDTSNALNAVADPDCTRKDMAVFYADLLRCHALYPGQIDWPAINNAILKRWPRGLEYIKSLAWKEVSQR